jgi:predicted exporter
MKKPFSPFPEPLKRVSALADKWGAFVWAAVHGGILALLLISLFPALPLTRVRFNTNLYDILPPSHNLKAVAAADKMLGDRNARQIFILSAAADFEEARNGAALLYRQCSGSPAFENVSLYVDAGVIAEFTRYLYDYRFVMADEETRKLLEGGRAGEIAEDALAAAFGAFNFVPLDTIEADPFLLTNRRLEQFLSSSLLSSGSMSLRDGVLSASAGETWYVLVRGTLSPAGASITNNDSGIKKIYAAAAGIVEQIPGLRFYYSGVPFHSYESSSNAQREISLISIITLLIVILIFLYVFRSPLPVFFSVLAAGMSIVLATASALLVFREIHVMTFVFGTTLIGTSIDYSVHFFVHWKGSPSLKTGNEIRSHIIKSMLMSFVSTVICFLGLLFAPFPILKQFAVFSLAGMLSSFLTAVCLYPRLVIPAPSTRRLPVMRRPLIRGRHSRSWILIVMAAGTLLVLFINRDSVKIENNIAALYTMSPSMLESEKTSAMVLNHGSAGWYFIVSGSGRQETLENEEILLARLEEEILRGNLRSLLGTSVFIPSVQTQKKNYHAMKALIPLAEVQYENLGFPPGSIEIFHRDFIAAEEKYSLPGENIPPYIGDLISNLWIGETGGRCYSCVLPLHPGDEAAFRAIAEEFDFVFFVNKVKDVGKELDTLTRTMMVLFLGAYFLIAILARFFYSPRDTLRICAVPIFLSLVTLAVLAARNIPLGFFSAAALVLVFGLGLDYIFYLGEGSRSRMSSLTTLGVFLSFATTALSFGVLALSSFTPVHIFGLTVFAGLTAAFTAAMLLSGRTP